MNRSLAVVFAAGIVFLSLGCATVPSVTTPTIADAEARARLAQDAARRVRADVIVKAALPGIEGVVVNATLDVACEAPKRLSVSVRSFFEVPQQVLVSNGKRVTLYDATSGAPRFAQGPATERSLERLLGVPLAPDDAVALLLGRAPLEPDREGYPAPRVRVVSVDGAAGTYTVVVERVGRGALHMTARLADDAIVGVAAFTGDGRPLITAVLDDHGAHNGVPFAKRVTVSTAQGERVVLSVQDGRYNGDSLPAEAFTLTPPPGVVVDEL